MTLSITARERMGISQCARKMCFGVNCKKIAQPVNPIDVVLDNQCHLVIETRNIQSTYCDNSLFTMYASIQDEHSS